MRSFDRTTGHEAGPQVAMPSGEVSESTREMFETAGQQMLQRDYAGAVATYEGFLDRISEIPPEQLSAYYGDLGLAHLYQGQNYEAEGEDDKAREHYTRAAFMFEQAASTATFPVIRSVAEYYRMIAHFHAGDYALARNAGEEFLRQGPAAAILAELLPKEAPAIAKELLAVSYFQLAERALPNEAMATSLRENGLRHAEEAIVEAPDRIIQPYYLTGVAAWERGDFRLAEERLQSYLDIMRQIPSSRWDEIDRQSVAEAEQLIAEMRGLR